MLAASFSVQQARATRQDRFDLDHVDRPPTALTVAFREPKMARFLRRARLG